MIKHFLSLASLSKSDLFSLLERSHFFSQNIHHPSVISKILEHKIFVNAFYEPSTRTRCSFEMAGKRLGAQVINFSPENSSVKKGETIYDTLKTLESLGSEAIVLRHSDDHVFEDLKDSITCPMINAGAGKHEHPTQGLLDLLTLKQEFGNLEGLKIAICGDVKHSRVAGSMMVAAKLLGMNLFFAGPKELLPSSASGAKFDDLLPEMDAVMMLRIQLERHETLDLDANRYHDEFGMNFKRSTHMKKKAIILHPGPFNRGVEISDEMVEHQRSRIFKQMANGVYARMAVLEWTMKERA